MDFKKIIKDKRVIYGGGAALALVVVFVFIKSGKPAAASSDEGNSDTGSMYFPVDFSSLGIGGGTASNDSDPQSALIDLGKAEIKASTQVGLAGIGSDFLAQIADKFKTKSPGAGKLAGVTGTFGYDEGGMLDFDFSFKSVKPTPTTPKQNTTVPTVRTAKAFAGPRDDDNRAGFGGQR